MNSPGIEAARKLAHLGYRFQVTGSTIKARYKGTGEPNPAQVRPLLALVKEHKKEVLTYLNKPAPRERVLTCADCPHFEANHGPNPREGWGHCRKQNRGRYGVAMACKTILYTPAATERPV